MEDGQGVDRLHLHVQFGAGFGFPALPPAQAGDLPGLGAFEAELAGGLHVGVKTGRGGGHERDGKQGRGEEEMTCFHRYTPVRKGRAHWIRGPGPGCMGCILGLATRNGERDKQMIGRRGRCQHTERPGGQGIASHGRGPGSVHHV